MSSSTPNNWKCWRYGCPNSFASAPGSDSDFRWEVMARDPSPEEVACFTETVEELMRDLDQRESLLPLRPPPSQAHPEETIRRAEASIRTREDTQLVSQGKDLEEQVCTRGQG